MREDTNYWMRRPGLNRLSRRRFVGGVALAGAGAAAFSLAGCGDDDDDGGEQASPTVQTGGTTTPTAPAATPTPSAKTGGVLRTSSSNATYDSFDISRSRFTPVATIVGYCYQRIVQWDSFAEGRIGGAFAEKWEQPDAQTFVFKLRPNNFFHNKAPVSGRQTTAEDMKFHIERNKAGKLQDGADDPNFYRKTNYGIVESVTVTDPQTVTVKLNKPSPLFLNLLAQSYEGIQAPEAVKLFEKDYANFDQKMIIGTGPYVLTEFSSEGRLKFKRFDKFSRKTNLDGLAFVPLFTDNAALQAAWEQKQVDSFGPSTVQALNDLNERYKGKIRDTPAFSANPIVGGYFNASAPPWNNPNLIGAVFRAYDRRQLIQQFHGGRGAISGSIPPTQSAFAVPEKELITLPGYLVDRDKEMTEAKKMWEAGGGAALGDVTLDVADIFEGLYQASSILIAMLNKNLGVGQFKAKTEPYTTITSKVVQRKYGNGNANLWYGWDTEVLDPEPTSFLVANYLSTSELNKQFEVKIPGLDDILNKVAVELNQDKRKEMTREAERLLLKNWGGGRIYSHVQIVNSLSWNYLHGSEGAPFSTAHLVVNTWIDPDDPTYQGRPSDAGIV